MGVRITDERHVALYDSTTGIAFGPTFESADEAEAFLVWYRRGFEKDGKAAIDLRDYGTSALWVIGNDWRTFRDDHPEAQCPFDGDDVSEPGWTSAQDVSHGDYTEAVPRRCGCDCHERGDAAEGRA
jgi:hypothetical protein